MIHKDDKGVIVTAPRARLDQLMAAFGEDRVMFGGDWPNSVGTATIPEALALMRDYFAGRPRLQAEKYFWRNSRTSIAGRNAMPRSRAKCCCCEMDRFCVCAKAAASWFRGSPIINQAPGELRNQRH